MDKKGISLEFNNLEEGNIDMITFNLKITDMSVFNREALKNLPEYISSSLAQSLNIMSGGTVPIKDVKEYLDSNKK